MEPIYFTTRGAGPPLVFIHGFCETGEIWKSFIDKLANGFQVITIDLPGFGRSKLSDPNITIDGIGDIINRRVDDQRLENPILIGHSLGGYVALSMIAHRPGRFPGLVLFHSTALADNEAKRENRNRVFEFVKAHGVATFIDSFVASLYHVKNHPSIEDVKKIALETPELTFLAYTKAMRDRSDASKILTGTTVPILLLAGRNDAVIPLETLVKQADLSDKITLNAIDGVGHMGMFEAPEESAAVLNGFIAAIKKTLVP